MILFQNGRHTHTHTFLNVEVPAYKYAAPKNMILKFGLKNKIGFLIIPSFYNLNSTFLKIVVPNINNHFLIIFGNKWRHYINSDTCFCLHINTLSLYHSISNITYFPAPSIRNFILYLNIRYFNLKSIFQITSGHPEIVEFLLVSR